MSCGPFPWCRDKAPGQQECDEAIETVTKCIRDVDQASLAAISQQLAPREGISQEVSWPCSSSFRVRLSAQPDQEPSVRPFPSYPFRRCMTR